MFIKIATLLAMMASLNGVPAQNHSVYIRTMRVIEINYDTDVVTCVDAIGEAWEFEGCEDYATNDLVSCLMDTMGTEDSIYDDAILFTNYTGYQAD